MIDDGIATIGDLSSNMLQYAKTWKLEPEATDLGQDGREYLQGHRAERDREGSGDSLHCPRRSATGFLRCAIDPHGVDGHCDQRRGRMLLEELRR